MSKGDCRPDNLMRSHAQREALRACRTEAGNRKATIDTLIVMAARDPLLAESLFRVGVQKAALDAAHEFKALVQTGGLYRACHPDA